jgi:hypothetical protein
MGKVEKGGERSSREVAAFLGSSLKIEDKGVS